MIVGNFSFVLKIASLFLGTVYQLHRQVLVALPESLAAHESKCECVYERERERVPEKAV